MRIYDLDHRDNGRMNLRAEKIFYVVFPMNFLELLLLGGDKTKQFLISCDSHTWSLPHIIQWGLFNI